MDAALLMFLIGVSLGGLIGYICGDGNTENTYRKEAIENGYARYHPVTGEFEWIKKATDPDG